MTKDEMKNRISMALKDPVLQQGFELICKELEAEKKLNEEIKVRFVKCNTCTDEMKNKCSTLLDKLYLSGLKPNQVALVERMQDVLGV